MGTISDPYVTVTVSPMFRSASWVFVTLKKTGLDISVVRSALIMCMDSGVTKVPEELRMTHDSACGLGGTALKAGRLSLVWKAKVGKPRDFRKVVACSERD